MPFTLHGLAVSQGIAIGHVHLVSHALLEVNHYHVAPRYRDEVCASGINSCGQSGRSGADDDDVMNGAAHLLQMSCYSIT